MQSQQFLKKEALRLLELRKKQFPRFGKHDLADELGIHRVSFYQFLAGKRIFRRKTALKYFKHKLGDEKWGKLEREFIREETASSNLEPVRLYETDEDYPQQSRDQYEFNSDPLSWALIHLLEVEDYQPCLKWKAWKLGISEKSLLIKLNRLVRLGLIEKTDQPEGFRRRTDRRIETTDTKINPSIKNFRKNLLPIMERAFDLDPKTEQDFYNWTCPIDPKDLPEFQKLIRRFVKVFDKKQFGSKPKRIYTLMVGLFPLSK